MKMFSFAYVGTFVIVIATGFLITLWVTYRTTFKNDRLPYDPPLEQQTGADETLELASLGQIVPDKNI